MQECLDKGACAERIQMYYKFNLQMGDLPARKATRVRKIDRFHSTTSGWSGENVDIIHGLIGRGVLAYGCSQKNEVVRFFSLTHGMAENDSLEMYSG